VTASIDPMFGSAVQSWPQLPQFLLSELRSAPQALLAPDDPALAVDPALADGPALADDPALPEAPALLLE